MIGVLRKASMRLIALRDRTVDIGELDVQNDQVRTHGLEARDPASADAHHVHAAQRHGIDERPRNGCRLRR